MLAKCCADPNSTSSSGSHNNSCLHWAVPFDHRLATDRDEPVGDKVIGKRILGHSRNIHTQAIRAKKKEGCDRLRMQEGIPQGLRPPPPRLLQEDATRNVQWHPRPDVGMWENSPYWCIVYVCLHANDRWYCATKKVWRQRYREEAQQSLRSVLPFCQALFNDPQDTPTMCV